VCSLSFLKRCAWLAAALLVDDWKETFIELCFRSMKDAGLGR